MEISKNQILKAVNQVIPGIDKEANFVGADCVFFDKEKLKTFNDQIGFSIPLVDFGFQCAVNAKELQAILKKCKKEMIDIELNDCLSIKAGRIKAELNLIETNDLIKKYEFFNNPVWQETSTEFLDNIKDVIILKNTIDYEGICISENEMYCTDNLRINRVKFDNKLDPKNVWFPTEAVSYLIKNTVSHWYEKDNFIVFKTLDGVEIVFRQYPFEDYPLAKLKGIFESISGKGESYEFDDSVKEVLDQMAVTSVKQFDDSVWNDAINVVINDKIVLFSGESDSAKMTAETELTTSVSKEFEGKEFIVSIGQFQKAVEKTKTFKLIENILYFETGNIEYLVCIS